LGRVIRVDHAANYKPPKDSDEADELTKFLREEGCSIDVIAEKKDKIERLTEKKDKDSDSKPFFKQEPDRKLKHDDGYDKYKERDRDREREREREKDRDRHSHKKEKKRRSRTRSRSPRRSHHHDDKNHKKSHRY
jgi:hypothetical protein